jgi:acyl-CoA hydrolase
MHVNISRQRTDALLSGAKSIYVSACAAEIDEAPALFRKNEPVNAVVTGIFSPLVNRRSYADPDTGMRVRSFFLTRELKQHLALGMVDYLPWRYRVIDDWLSTSARFDTALVMLSPPDANGKCSLGVQADFLPRFHHRVDRLIGFINPFMPHTSGDTLIDYNSLTAAVDYEVPLKTIVQKAPDVAATKIATAIAALVKDQSTVQFGIGQIPSQVIALLGDHRGLRVHSGIVDDNILALEASGALDRDVPIVTGTAIGTAQLYNELSNESRFSFRSVFHTHNHNTIASLDRFTAINSVLQVDLFGQASSESSGGRLVASPGGLPDFVRGALCSDGGQSIIAVRAKGIAAHSRGIVPLLESPHAVTNTAADADIIVTEYGVARVRNLSLDERAEAILSIADPDDQQHLMQQWKSIRERVLPS